MIIKKILLMHENKKRKLLNDDGKVSQNSRKFLMVKYAANVEKER
jgi:hypothetical protein